MNRVLNFTVITVSLAVFLACGKLNAATEKVGRYTWTYRINGGTAEIGGNNGATAVSPLATGAVTIPSTLGGKPVTSLGRSALRLCSGLTNVTIPDSVTSIGDEAFQECSGLTSVTIHDMVTSIGEKAFQKCGGLTSVTIPDSVTSIGTGAFSYCTNLTRVTIGNGVTNIGGEAFVGCFKLKNVTIPNSVMSIGTSAFDSCPSLWSEWYRSLADGQAYNLAQTAGDRAIASVTVNADSAIDSFVLKDGKVYDSVLYINNTADHAVTLTLPSGYVYKAIKGATPLVIPSNSQSILSITRVAEQVFIVSREDLETIQ